MVSTGELPSDTDLQTKDDDEDDDTIDNDYHDDVDDKYDQDDDINVGPVLVPDTAPQEARWWVTSWPAG